MLRLLWIGVTLPGLRQRAGEPTDAQAADALSGAGRALFQRNPYALPVDETGPPGPAREARRRPG